MQPQTHFRDTLPSVPFFLFGAGARRKLRYQKGNLFDALIGELLFHWDIRAESIRADRYTVSLNTADDASITLHEDEAGVWLTQSGRRTLLTSGTVTLPAFEGHPHQSLLRILHHEILVNIVDGKPLPNLFVYARPWMRDAAMMALALERTGNVGLLTDWITALRDPFDRNNRGIAEADNLGQALYLISLVADADHPLVRRVFEALPAFERNGHIAGLSDFAERPVYQTKWLKFGLRRLGLPDPYVVPNVADQYASLFWMDGQPAEVTVPAFSQRESDLYPYLAWAEAHTTCKPPPLHLLRESYPLTWEAHASEADYAGMTQVDASLCDARVCMPHTWHAAEAFLYLL